jgi:hypothetical protein
MDTTTPTLALAELFTDSDGRARWRDALITLDQGSPASRLSCLLPSAGFQWRESPVGFRSAFHCTTTPQWLVVLSGCMEIGLQDGSTRRFGPGEVFYSNDVCPPGVAFDPEVHGHWSRQVGDAPLRTLFVRA